MWELAEDYYWVMAARHRLVAGYDGTVRKIFCTFFVLADESEIPRFYCRPLWSTPIDGLDGPLIYIDKLMATAFSTDIFRQIERAITAQVPSWQRAVWYRPGHDADRRYTYYRRDIHAYA